MTYLLQPSFEHGERRLDLGLLGAEECVAAAALGIAGLLLLLVEAALRANEFLHRFGFHYILCFCNHLK